MGYRLQEDESLSGGLKRIAEEEATGAINLLQSHEDVDRSIYEVRKRLKKIRSILRLLEPHLGPVYTEENRRLRDVARRFSGMRDLRVSMDLLEDFSKQYKRKSTLDPHLQALSARQAQLKEQTDWETEFKEAVEALNGMRKRVEDWPVRGLTPAFADAQIRKTQKQSRQAYLRAKETRTPEDFHEFRKSVKRELNQVRLLRPEDASVKPLKRLSTLLGDHHNLAVLLATVENASGRFRAMAQRDLRRHESEILALALQLYEMNHHVAVA